uniref:KIND domain-containing protein n=1 Tax=Phasianus colchicus TaxID=9054 RepID=A0A669QHE5_PHACC
MHTCRICRRLHILLPPLLVQTTESAMDIFKENSTLSKKQPDPIICVICPWSILLSAEGNLSFQNNASQTEAIPFSAPELLHRQNKNQRIGLMKVRKISMLVYSLGMTLYWSADYQVPPNQSLQLSDQLHSLLLTLCEDLPHKRLSPESILEVCEAHQKESSSSPANTYIKKMVQFVVGSVSEVGTILLLNNLLFTVRLSELQVQKLDFYKSFLWLITVFNLY